MSGDEDGGRGDRRWPRWASIVFVLGSSVLLWALIVAGVWWLVVSG